MSENDERHAVLLGQVHALKQFAGAIALVSKDRARIEEAFKTTSQFGLSFLETSGVPDRAIVAFQEICDDLFLGLRTAELPPETHG